MSNATPLDNFLAEVEKRANLAIDIPSAFESVDDIKPLVAMVKELKAGLEDIAKTDIRSTDDSETMGIWLTNWRNDTKRSAQNLLAKCSELAGGGNERT